MHKLIEESQRQRFKSLSKTFRSNWIDLATGRWDTEPEIQSAVEYFAARAGGDYERGVVAAIAVLALTRDYLGVEAYGSA